MTAQEKEICEKLLQNAYNHIKGAKNERIMSEESAKNYDDINYVIHKCNSNYLIGKATAIGDVLIQFGYKEDEVNKLNKIIQNYWSENWKEVA